MKQFINKSEILNFDYYTSIIKNIKYLSSPMLNGVSGSDEYQKNLKENFERINGIFNVSENILNTSFYPLINKEGDLTREEILRGDYNEELPNMLQPILG